MDKQFVGTIRDHGVLVPIVAIDTPDGVRVRFGHRRTLAAVEAGLDTVPVIVVEPESGDPDSDVAERNSGWPASLALTRAPRS